MPVVRIVPAAHFLRSGNVLVVGLVLASPFVLMIPHRGAVRALQILLALGFVEWMRTSYVLASMRDAAGMPWVERDDFEPGEPAYESSQFDQSENPDGNYSEGDAAVPPPE